MAIENWRSLAPQRLRRSLSEMRHRWQEFYELGAGGTLFRVYWQGLGRLEPALAAWGLEAHLDSGEAAELASPFPPVFADPEQLRQSCASLLGEETKAQLRRTALAACEGRILGFGHLQLDHGNPFDWQLNPLTGKRWPAELHWRRVLQLQAELGDVKLSWEAGRFPQLYHLSRAAVFFPAERERFAAAAAEQIGGFIAANPPLRGIHWASGQEVAFRLMAWTFALHVLDELRQPPLEQLVARAMVEGAIHIENHLSYAQHAVYNNHLLSEALGLLLVGTLVPSAPRAGAWRMRGLELLSEQAERQFYPDGGYIQQSHSYHRVALTDLLWAVRLAEQGGQRAPTPIYEALARSVHFLWSHQNPKDGSLPNYGNNDGAQPSLLSCCPYPDYRPTLEAAACAGGRRPLYAPGPWSEEASWYFGPASVTEAAPRAPRRRTSASFPHSGHHVLRGAEPGTFCTFRCGTLRDRFSQIDMLHVDYWYRGENVLVDAGTFHYNGAPRWHRHFMGGAAHNTLLVDDLDQMLHYRQFKVLYPTQARLLAFSDAPEVGTSVATGEHYGFTRALKGCVHRRSVLLTPELLIVLDTLFGSGDHQLRLHWLAAPLPSGHDAESGALHLQTATGWRSLRCYDAAGAPLITQCYRGDESGPTGWLSRHYASKQPAPALIHTARHQLPAQVLTVLGPAEVAPRIASGAWHFDAARGSNALRLRLTPDGQILVSQEQAG